MLSARGAVIDYGRRPCPRSEEQRARGSSRVILRCTIAPVRESSEIIDITGKDHGSCAAVIGVTSDRKDIGIATAHARALAGVAAAQAVRIIGTSVGPVTDAGQLACRKAVD